MHNIGNINYYPFNSWQLLRILRAQNMTRAACCHYTIFCQTEIFASNPGGGGTYHVHGTWVVPFSKGTFFMIDARFMDMFFNNFQHFPNLWVWFFL